MCGIPIFVTDRELAALVCRSLLRLISSHGFGYRDTSYRGLLAADLGADGMECLVQPTANIRVGGQTLGQSVLDCVLVENRCAVKVLALRDTITATDRAQLQTSLKHLALPWGIIVNFGKANLELRWVKHPMS